MSDNKQPPTTNNQQTTTDNMPPTVVEDTLPPMISSSQPSTVISDQSSPTIDSGSAAPSDDVVMPAIVTTGPNLPAQAGKKFAGGKFIATILGLFLLVGGVGAGTYLVQQNQNINEEAKALNLSGSQKNAYDKCREDSGSQVCACRVAGECTRPDYQDDPQSPANPVVTPAPEKTGGIYTCESGSAPECVGKKNGENSGDGKTCKIREDGKTCSSVKDEALSDVTPTVAPTTAPTAQCQNIKAYSPTWALLTTTQLSALTVGSQVNFCVTGSATSESFDRAKFTINGVVQAETTTIRPGSTDFCQSYVIPAGVTTFNVTAQIHHITLGWK